MTFHAKNTLLLLAVVASVAILMGIGASFILNAKLAPVQVIEPTTLPPTFTAKDLRVPINGTVQDTFVPYSAFTIIDTAGVEKYVTVATTTKIFETVIQYDESGTEVTRLEREVNIGDLRGGDAVEIRTLTQQYGGVVDTVKYTTKITSGMDEYLKESASENRFLRGVVTAYTRETGSLMLARVGADGVQSPESIPLILPLEEVIVYELSDVTRSSIIHTHTPKSLTDIEVGDMVHVFISGPDAETKLRSIHALLIIPTS